MRIVPKEIQPTVDKKVIDIPLENTQPGLPEPKRQAKRSKKQPKKFHMPDGVQTGFVKASRLNGRKADSQAESGEDGELVSSPPTLREPTPELEPIPSLEDVLLTATEEQQLERTYLDIGGDTPQTVEVPKLDAFPALQRELRPTKHLNHGRTTRRVVQMLSAMHAVDLDHVKRFEEHLHPDDKRIERTNPRLSARSNHMPESAASVNSPARPSSSQAARRMKSPLRHTLTLTSSAGEEDTDDDLSGFVVHSSQEADAQGAVSSVTSSPPPMEKPFYIPLGKEYRPDSDTDEELPEFDSLVGKTTAVQSSGRASGQRRGKRRVVRDESDDA